MDNDMDCAGSFLRASNATELAGEADEEDVIVHVGAEATAATALVAPVAFIVVVVRSNAVPCDELEANDGLAFIVSPAVLSSRRLLVLVACGTAPNAPAPAEEGSSTGGVELTPWNNNNFINRSANHR